ncbi:MAG: ABC transporter ATP-binding protein [Mesorhizobium sp.]
MSNSQRQDVHVAFRGVEKRFGGKVLAVDALDLDILRGEFLTLLGPSGSGKTTALMMLAGFETPTRGHITVDGTSVEGVAPNRRGIGMVFQNYALFPHMSVGENLAFPLEVRRLGKAGIEEKVRNALDMVRLPGVAGRMPDQLSGGQQQRIAVARALIFEPKLVLMDEPLGALDRQLREQMQLEIRDIHRRLGVTFVYVTHDQTEALTMSDRIAVFNAGRVQQVSTPSELYEHPRTGFVAGFIGENNRLPGVVEAISGQRIRVALDNGDGVVEATALAGDWRTGDRVVLSVRPERLALVPEDAPAGLRATMRQSIYAGDHLRIVAETKGGRSIVVKQINAADAYTPAIGAELRIGWRAEDCLALAP